MARGVREVEFVRGDGSSRLVLRRAGLEEAEALIAASRDDQVNLEACRYARELGIRTRVVGGWQVREKRRRRGVDIVTDRAHIEGVEHLPVLSDVVRTAPEVIKHFRDARFPPPTRGEARPDPGGERRGRGTQRAKNGPGRIPRDS